MNHFSNFELYHYESLTPWMSVRRECLKMWMGTITHSYLISGLPLSLKCGFSCSILPFRTVVNTFISDMVCVKPLSAKRFFPPYYYNPAPTPQNYFSFTPIIGKRVAVKWWIHFCDCHKPPEMTKSSYYPASKRHQCSCLQPARREKDSNALGPQTWKHEEARRVFSGVCSQWATFAELKAIFSSPQYIHGVHSLCSLSITLAEQQQLQSSICWMQDQAQHFM